LFNRHFKIVHLTEENKTSWKLQPDWILHTKTTNRELRTTHTSQYIALVEIHISLIRYIY